MGLHTANKITLPTSMLPWALVLGSSTSASMNGIGSAPLGLVPGTWVAVQFMDEPDCQQPIIIGSVGGIPGEKSIYEDAPGESITFKDSDKNSDPSTITTTDKGE